MSSPKFVPPPSLAAMRACSNTSYVLEDQGDGNVAWPASQCNIIRVQELGASSSSSTAADGSGTGGSTGLEQQQLADSSTLSGGAIAGIAIGSTAAFVLLVGLPLLMLLRKWRARDVGTGAEGAGATVVPATTNSVNIEMG